MKYIKLIIIAYVLIGSLYSCQFENFDKRCMREAKEYTEKQCPRRMDAYTIMDSMIYSSAERTLHYYYTIEGELDNEKMEEADVREELNGLLLNHIINAVELKTYKEHKISFCYHYHSQSSGSESLKFLFGPEQYRSHYSGDNK